MLDALAADGVAPPTHVALTHSHWDHVFGAAELEANVIAHALTAESLTELAATDWNDEALERRVAAGENSPEHAAHVKEELPSPREVVIALADIVFHDRIEIELGGVSVHVQHVGGDHAADSSVMYVRPDRLLFLGDCLYNSPTGTLTAERALPLHEAVLGFDADVYVEGHSETVLRRGDVEGLIGDAGRELAPRPEDRGASGAAKTAP